MEGGFFVMGEDEIVQKRCFFSGRVQGVCFRAWTQRFALDLGVHGWVRNLRDGRVEALFVGPRGAGSEMIRRCREEQPNARVAELQQNDEIPDPSIAGFRILY